MMTTVAHLSLSERLKLNKLNRSGPAAFGSLNSLIRLSGLSRVKVSHFFASKPSETKYKNRRRKFPRLQVEARFINDIRCMDLAQLDKFSWNFNTKFIMVSVDLFSRLVRVQPMRRKTLRLPEQLLSEYVPTKVNKLSFAKKLWVDRGKEFFLEISEISAKM